MTTTPTAQHVLRDTIHRYMCGFYDQPKCVRATWALRRMLKAELMQFSIVDDSGVPSITSDEVQFMGVRIKFDLPGKAVAALAVHDQAS